MANVIKTEWFGKQISVVMVNGKTVSGELSEVSDNYIVLTRDKGEVQIMVGAMVMVAPAAEKAEQRASRPAAADSGPDLFEDAG